MSAQPPSEKTFKAYTKDQGAKYAKSRPPYSDQLYQRIVNHHTSTGGQLNVLLDVGCGPGTTARVLAPQFAHAVGLDPSEGMITAAKDLGGTSSASEPIRFEVAAAEDLGSNLSPPIEDGSVDLLTASTAAHWFDMERFWKQAARVLRPGGTVAIWSSGNQRVHPDTPNAAALQAVMDDIDERELQPYYEAGNRLAGKLYEGMLMPWALDPPLPEFKESDLSRKEWGPEDSEEYYSTAALTVDLDTMDKIYSTMSPIQRWRDGHPEDAGTERDVVRRMRREVEKLLREAGVEPGKEVVRASTGGVLIIVKKAAAV